MQEGPNIHHQFPNAAKAARQAVELGTLSLSNIENEELALFESRAKGWEYMVNFDKMDEAIGRYSSNLTKKLRLFGGGLEGLYMLSSKEISDNIASILIASKTTKPPFSHVDLMGTSGGKFYIAKDAQEVLTLNEASGTAQRSAWHTETNFLNLYALYCLYGHKNWLVEQKLDIFRYFIDLDFKQPGILLPEKIEAIVFIVVRAIEKFFPDSDKELLKCICSSTVCKVDRCKACLCECQGQKDCEKCKGVGNTGKKGALACTGCGGEFPVTKKTGVHLHFPNIFVNASQALDMRETVIAECTRVWGFRSSPFNAWSEVIDEVVYKQSGLRMMCAHKGEFCKQCKAQKSGEICGACRNTRRIDQGRPYFPLLCTNGKGLRDKAVEEYYQNNFSGLIADTSIRYYGESCTSGYSLYDGAPTSATSFKVKPTTGIKLAGKKRVLSEATGILLSQQLALDAPEVRAIQSFFSEESVKNKHCSSFYGELVVSQVKYKKKDESFKVDVSGKNSRYCMNKGDNHGGNRVYFLFRASTADHSMGVVQKCYCEKEEARKYGPCSTYTSSPMTLPHKIASLLFPSSGAQGGGSMAEESSVLTRMDFRGMSQKARSQNQLLLTAGNIMCKDLFNTVWTNSPRFCGMFGSSMLETSALPKTLTVYRPFKMDSVGPDDVKALKWISLHGFGGSSRKSQHAALDMQEEDDLHEKISVMKERSGKSASSKQSSKKGMESIEKRLNAIITNILGVALHHDEDKILRTLEKQTLVDLAKGVPEQPDFNILECLDLFIVESQRIRILHANISGSQEGEIFDTKKRRRLSTSIMQKMQKSLVKLLTYRHDEPMENSYRHTGFGWSAEVVDKKFREKVRQLILSLHEKL
jgi:hypothetical protein